MVVDDSRVSRMMIRAICLDRQPQWQVLEAANGQEALALAEAHRVDYASVDINMPGMDGLELAERLKTIHPEIRVCLLSANIQESSRLRAEAAGAGFVKKPINEHSIEQVMTFFRGA